MTTRGFLLGKFMPPHAGHLHCAEVGRARCDEMTVLVCSHDAEPIDGCLRAEWMRACLTAPGYRVVHMHRDIPQAPEDHPDFWPIWRAAIAEHHPEPIDWVFGSEAYVHRLAAEVGARPFPVDPERRVVPVSASAIRADPSAHWGHVPSPVRSFFQRRVVLLGAESTGKTTLSEALASDQGAVPVPEYGRDYDALFRHGQTWEADDFAAIVDGHAALATAVAMRGGPMVIEDTDAIQTLVWAEALLGSVPKELVAQAQSLAGEGRKTYLLLDHATPWHDDGTRHFPDPARRAWFTERLEAWLEAFGADWHRISGPDWAARAAAARSALGCA